MSAVAVGAAVAGAATSYGLSQMDGGSGSTGTQSQSTSSAPWGPQQPYLTYGFDRGQTALSAALSNPVYRGYQGGAAYATTPVSYRGNAPAQVNQYYTANPQGVLTTVGGKNTSPRDPNAFNEEYYLKNNPDVAAAVARGDYKSGLDHYQKYGQSENRINNPGSGSMAFDEDYYLRTNPDVAAAVARGDYKSGQDHFNQYGYSEARPMSAASGNQYTATGDLVAPLHKFQGDTANLAGNFATNNFGTSQNALNLGQLVMNTGGQFAGNANSLFNAYTSNPYAAFGMGDTLANSKYGSNLIDAAGRDVTRNLYENQLPTLAKAAAGSGNTNSTRAGVESAIAQRGAADRLADISAAVRGQLFNQGMGQFNQNLQNSLAANSQLYNAYNSGMQGMLNGQNMAANYFDMGQAAGGVYQNQYQREIDADRRLFNEANALPLDYIGKYQGIVNGNYGGTGTSFSSGTPATASVGNTLLGGAALGYGLYNKLGGYNTTNNQTQRYDSNGIPLTSSGGYAIDP